MSRVALIRGNQDKLTRLLSSVANTMADTLQALVDRPIVIKPGTLELASPEELAAPLDVPAAVAIGALGNDSTRHSIRFLFDGRDAVTLSALMMMESDEIIIDRRFKGILSDDDLANLAEVSNVLCSATDTLLTERLGRPVGLRGAGHGRVGRDAGNLELLGSGRIVAYPFSMQVSSYPKTRATILLDSETAELWNERTLIGDPEASPSDFLAGSGSYDAIPPAPIRGTLACYVSDPTAFDIVRRSCRRVGLEMKRHSTSDIPNPAGHKHELVLLDVPVGQDRRFEWSKRLKEYDENIGVVLLVHHPSKSRIVQSFLSKADAILGWPIEELELSSKLTALVETLPEPLKPPSPD